MKECRMAAVIVMIVGLLLLAACGDGNEAAQVPEDAEEYTITTVRGTDDIDWDTIPEAEITCVLWTDNAGITGTGQICCDEENLYVRMRAEEKGIRAENTKPYSPVYEDSCLEFFFMRAGAENYFNFEMNPRGCTRIEYGPSREDRTALYREDEKTYFDIETDRTETGWEIRYRIPLKFLTMLDGDFRFSGDLRANLYKCGSRTAHRHYVSWSPVHSEKSDFHRPQDFGVMHFEQ